jgi:hypothetical protein
MRARLRACLLGCASVFAARTAAAEPSERETFGAVELRWRAPAACPTTVMLRERIERDRTAPIADDLPLSVLVDAEVVARPDGRLTMKARTSSATGAVERMWIADDCETLADVAVVLVVSAIEETTPRAPAPAPAAPPPVAASAPPAPSVATEDVRPRSRFVPVIGFRPALGVEIHGLPRAGFATNLAMILAWRYVRLDVSGLYATPRVIEQSGGAGAVLQLATFAARGCGRLLTRWVELPLCAGLEVGAVFGRGVGVDDGKRDTVLWAAALLGPALVIRAHRRLGVSLDGHVAFPLGRPSFDLQPYGTVWRAGIGGRVLIGLEVWFSVTDRPPADIP